MVPSTARMLVWQVSNYFVMPTDRLNKNQARMKRSLLGGKSLSYRTVEYVIKMTMWAWFHGTDLYQECN